MKRISTVALLATLGTATIGHAARATLVTIDYSGLTDPNANGGSLHGTFVYNTASTPVAGLYSLVSFTIAETINGINIGGPYAVPQVASNSGYIQPGGVSSEPETDGSVLVGVLDMVYTAGSASIYFDLTFNANGSASGTISVPYYSESETFSTSAVTYTVQPATVSSTGVPEPASVALLGAGLLGVAGTRRRR